jgi:predicted secreted Zn-dependent protease
MSESGSAEMDLFTQANKSTWPFVKQFYGGKELSEIEKELNRFEYKYPQQMDTLSENPVKERWEALYDRVKQYQKNSDAEMKKFKKRFTGNAYVLPAAEIVESAVDAASTY